MSTNSSTMRVINRMAYQYIGKYFEDRLDRFEELKRNLRRAGIDVSLRMYLSMTVFYAIVVGFIVALLTLVLVILFPVIPFPFILITGVLAGASVYAFQIVYPTYLISERKRKFDASLPTAASYMAAMSSAGVNPDDIFFSLSRDEIGLYVSEDAKKISRDIKIFGYDIIRSLDRASQRAPSSKYASFLEGINATNTSGGDLQSYFEASSKTLMRDKVQDERSFIDLLGLFAELFLVACIVTPTFGVVLIAMMALQVKLDHTTLVMYVVLMAVMLIPFLQLIILLMIDGSQPVE